MYLFFKQDGSIEKSIINEYVMQGSSGVNYVYVYFTGRARATYLATAFITLPDTDVIELAMSDNTFTYDGVEYAGYRVALDGSCTSQTGEISINVVLTDIDENQLATYTFSKTVNETSVSPTSEISYAQYMALISMIFTMKSYNLGILTSLDSLDTEMVLGTYTFNYLDQAYYMFISKDDDDNIIQTYITANAGAIVIKSREYDVATETWGEWSTAQESYLIDATATTITSRAQLASVVSEQYKLYMIKMGIESDADFSSLNGYSAFLGENNYITLCGAGTIYMVDSSPTYSTFRRSASKAELTAEITKITNGTTIALKASQDDEGHDIVDTYATKSALSAEVSRAEGVEGALDTAKADKATTYTKDETDNLLNIKADLVDGLVPASQLPSYVDDVINAYIVGATAFAFDWLSLTEGGSALTPESGKIYTIITVGDYHNNTYRWSGTQFVNSGSNLALGETSSTAYRGDRGKTAFDHSQVVSGNPHNTTKTDIGLGNVDNTSDANKPVSTAQQTALNSKANIDGYYAQLHSGLSDNLASPDGVTDTDGYDFRTSAGSQSITDGYAELRKILGNTVVWNQKVQNGNFTSTSNWTNYRSTGSVANNIYTLVGNANEVYCSILQDVGSVVGHKYYIRGEVMTPDSDISQIRISFDNSISGGQLSPSAGTWYKQSLIRTAVDTQGRAEALLYHATSINGKTLNVRNVFVLDLTLMFGVGNEPTTTSAVEQLFSLGYYAYSLPTMKSVDISGIKTVGFNLFNGTYAKVVAGVKVNVAGTFTDAEFALSVDGTKSAVSLTEETINDTTCHTFTPTYSGYLFINGSDATTCVSNVWSGYRVGDFEEYWTETRAINSSTYFPNGIHGVKVWNSGVASEVRDELLPDKYIKRFEIIDLGTLTWYVSESGTANERQATLGLSEVVKRPSAGTTKAYIVTNKYVSDTDSNSYSHVTNKVISVGSSDGAVYIYDSALIGKTNAEIKTAMSGVYLIYELATPIETPISPELTFTYKVSDFGTEEWLESNTPQVDVYHETFYMSNLRDTIRRLPLDYYDKEDVDALLADKISKTQDSWTSVALLNGHTGTLKVRKDNFGNVVGILDITTPNPFQAQAIAVLPEGFGPQVDETRYFRRSSGGDLIVWIGASARTFNAFAGSSAGVTIKGSFTFIKE